MIKASNEPEFDLHYYISLKKHTMTISKQSMNKLDVRFVLESCFLTYTP